MHNNIYNKIAKTAILFIALSSSIRAIKEEDSRTSITKSIVSLQQNDNKEFLFEANMNSDVLEEAEKVLRDHDYDQNHLDADGIATGLLGLLPTDEKRKWAIINMGYQVSCYQGRSTKLISASLYGYATYNGYGCYCGGGTYTGNYMDATDRCCKIHDECYARSRNKYGTSKGCHSYSTSYHVKCCEDEKITKCLDTGPSAGRDMCECDQEIARCFAFHMVSYNKSLLNNRGQCNTVGESTKVYSFMDIMKSCKGASGPRKQFNRTIPSQGECPVKKTNKLW